MTAALRDWQIPLGPSRCAHRARLRAARSPHRLVVRTSRCGRDNPGSTPGEGNLVKDIACRHESRYLPGALEWEVLYIQVGLSLRP